MKLFAMFFTISMACSAGATDKRIELSDSDLICAKESDCVLTAVACSCDYGTFVNQNAEKAIAERLKLMCENFEGVMCKMRAAYLWATCENKKCVTHQAHKCEDVSGKRHKALCRRQL